MAQAEGARVDLRRAALAPGVGFGRAQLRVEGLDGEVPTPLRQLLPGDRVRLRVRLRPPIGLANPGGRDRAHELEREGVAAVGYLAHPDLVVRLPGAEGPRPLRVLHALRERAGRRLGGVGPGGALIRALALGDRGGLAVETRDDFRRLGLAHLLAVSGLHLALIAALAYRAARRGLLRAGSRDPRRGSLLLALVAASLYALVAGWGVPVRRALLLLGSIAAAFAARRPDRRDAPLAGAAIAVLSWAPQALFDAGAQLSFAACAALVLGAARPSPAGGERRGLRERALALLHVSATAVLATAPLAAGSIGLLSPWALPANAVAVPWTALVLLPTALAGALVAALAPAGSGLGEAAIGGAVALAGASLEAVRAAAAALPPAWATAPAWPARALAGAVAIAVLRSHRPGLRVAAALAVTAGLVLAPPATLAPAPPRIVALDVGQGDATLIEGRRAAVLVDAGAARPGGFDLGRSAVVPALHALGVARLDVLVLSHGDADHRGGAPAVLSALRVDRMWLPRGAREDPSFDAVRRAAAARGVAVQERGAGSLPESVGDLRLVPLWPPAGGSLARNDRSLVLRIDLAGRRVLLPGDVEAAAEAALLRDPARLRSDVLKLPHHGSRTSSSAGFLAAAEPLVAIASAPRFGRFGMPHPEVRARVRDAGAALWWTGEDGAVLVGVGPRLWVRGWRPWRSRPPAWPQP